MKIGFDNELYLKVQREKIEERIQMFDNKLYLEFGGKLFDDYHASRVLPGFKPDSKIQLLKEFKDNLEVIFCINANDIEKNKIRADYGIGYDMELIRLIEKLERFSILVNSVVITMYQEQEGAQKLKRILEDKNIKVYFHMPIAGYPNDIEKVVSEEGYGKNPYIETSKKLVVVTAPGPNSGKLATCLSQLYHEHQKGVKAGYAKFETFPVWNLPLLHPVNVAYEAATADLEDINSIDPFHLEAYHENAVNYNRDISTFPILKNIITKIMGKEVYQSPTDMGVNMIKQCIIDDELIKKEASQEIIRRYYQAACDCKEERGSLKTVEIIQALMDKLGLTKKDRPVIDYILEKVEEKKKNMVALQLEDGRMITGKESELLSAPSALLLNTIKQLANLPDETYLLSPTILEAIFKMKKNTSYHKAYCLSLPEVLIALSICSANNPMIESAIHQFEKLRGCEGHASYIVRNDELNVIKSLGINLTCEPKLTIY